MLKIKFIKTLFLCIFYPNYYKVFRGIGLLNRVYGVRWVYKIDLNKLNIFCGHDCILGQLEGNYLKGLFKLFNSCDIKKSIEYGFCPGLFFPLNLTKLWKKLIIKQKKDFELIMEKIEYIKDGEYRIK